MMIFMVFPNSSQAALNSNRSKSHHRGYGLVMGLNYSNPQFEPHLDSSFQAGFSIGISSDFSFLIFNHLNLKALYSHRAYALSPLGTSSFDQIFLPLTAQVHFKTIHLIAGIFASYGVGSYNSFGNSVSYEAAQITKVDSGAVLGFGLNSKSWRFDLQYDLGLNDLSEVTGFSQRSRSLDFLLTYKF